MHAPTTHSSSRRRRTAHLRATGATSAAPPVLDDDGLLRYGSLWVSVPDSQLGIVRLLLDRPNRVVRTDVIAASYVAAGGSGNPGALKGLVYRLVDRFAEVGLDLRTIRGRGLVLEVPAPAGDEP